MPRDGNELFVDSPKASPSGLFTARAWERNRDSWQDCGEEDGVIAGFEDGREFALWVHCEAKTLAAQLDRLAPGGTGLARSIQALTDSLWADAEWARRQADGSVALAVSRQGRSD